MARPDRVREDPVEAFLGRSTVTDAYTHEQEDGFAYVCRHTLLRPRDLMDATERPSISIRPRNMRVF